jgi:hypothetical protein
MKPIKDKEREKIIFFSTVMLMVIAGIALNPAINKGLIKENVIQPLIKTNYPQPELFSPEKTMDFTPIFLGLIIIVLIILRKENIINPQKIEKCLYAIQKILKKYFYRLIKLAKNIENIPKIELHILKEKIMKILNYKAHKRIRYHYSKKIHPSVMKELVLLRDLFTKPYRPEFTHHFVVLLFVVAVIGMSLFALIVSPQKTAEIAQPLITAKVSSEMFSPEEVLSIWPILLGISITTIVSIIKIRKEKI